MKIAIILSLIGFIRAASWSYNVGDQYSPEKWGDFAATCSSPLRQSPIDLHESQAGIMYSSHLTDFEFHGYDNMFGSGSGLELSNNGHSAVLSVANVGQTYITGGGLNGTYIAVQLHYHWGPNDTLGSEHVYFGIRYPLEVHIVHIKQSYGTLADSVQHGDGIAVLGFNFEIDAYDNPDLNPLINGLNDIVYKGQTGTIAMNFSATIPDLSHPEYYRYEGSLTTPPCDEAVIWTVFENKMKISSNQLDIFRNLKQQNQTASTNLNLITNFRPIQTLGSRTVYKNFEGVSQVFKYDYASLTRGVDTWHKYYPTCRGKLQSPIDIPAVTSPEIAQYNANKMLHTLAFENYQFTVDGLIKNNGHTIQVDVNNNNMFIQNGGLEGQYRVAQFHFHWGTDSTAGSEHTHAGRKYPLELHIVHYNASYGDLATAVGKFDGLAVVGFWFEVGATNAKYDPIINSLEAVKFKGASQSITGFSLVDLTFDDLQATPTAANHNTFYRYQGGLTTPGCNQIVTWTMMTRTIPISEAQLAKFREMLHIEQTSRTLTEYDKIGWNYRPTQKMYDRVVHTSWNYESVMGPTDAAPIAMQSMITCLFVTIISFLLR